MLYLRMEVIKETYRQWQLLKYWIFVNDLHRTQLIVLCNNPVDRQIIITLSNGKFSRLDMTSLYEGWRRLQKKYWDCTFMSNKQAQDVNFWTQSQLKTNKWRRTTYRKTFPKYRTKALPAHHKGITLNKRMTTKISIGIYSELWAGLCRPSVFVASHMNADSIHQSSFKCQGYKNK